jgi:YD repeat-containing protein
MEGATMSSDAATPLRDDERISYSYDPDGRLLEVTKERKGNTVITYSYEGLPDRFKFEHDMKRKLFVLTGDDGKVEHFRDNPTRYLVVEPDGETGEMRPETRGGKPRYLYLCREEREV